MQRYRFSRSGMKEAISLSPASPSPSSENYHSSDVEEYQVETCSSSSSKDYQDEDDYETEGAVVVAEKPDLPAFGSVSVVNSSDVHFGNKTVYQGPVTIKQFLYPGSAVSGEGVSGIGEYVNILPTANGVDNNAFVNDGLKKDEADKTPSSDNSAQQTLPGIRKGFLWLTNLPSHHTRNIVIFISVVIVSITIVLTVIYGRLPGQIKVESPSGDTDEQDENTPVDYSSDFNATEIQKPRIMSRIEWLAQPPTKPLTPLKTPVSLIVIHDTSTEPCMDEGSCIFTVRYLQVFHVESNQLWDIGYNFLIGGDCAVYEGRGWKQEGAHTYGFNYMSLGVAFVGTFSKEVPPQNQTEVFNQLIAKGVELGHISKNYKIMAARQLESIENPGIAFYEEIQTWPRWSKVP